MGLMMLDSQAGAPHILTPSAVLSQIYFMVFPMYSKSKGNFKKQPYQHLECHHIARWRVPSLPTFNQLSKPPPQDNLLLQREPLLFTSPSRNATPTTLHSRLPKKAARTYTWPKVAEHCAFARGLHTSPMPLCAFDVCTSALERSRLLFKLVCTMPSQVTHKYWLKKGAWR